MNDPLPRKAILILNTEAGQAYAGEIRRLIPLCFPAGGWDIDVRETAAADSIADIVRAACAEGAGLAIAAGGDGTISRVANGLRGTDVPLAILPAGTGNILARGLAIPLGMEAALRLIAGEHDLLALDAMEIGGQWYLLNASVGVTAHTVRHMAPGQKRRYGVFSYLFAALQWFGWQPRRFTMTIDGREQRVRASEILVSSGEVLRELAVPVGPPASFGDGRLEVYIVKARSAPDYLAVVWNMLFRRGKQKSGLRHTPVGGTIRIDSGGVKLPVQADGDPIGLTPVEIKIIPAAVRVFVPSGVGRRG